MAIAVYKEFIFTGSYDGEIKVGLLFLKMVIVRLVIDSGQLLHQKWNGKLQLVSSWQAHESVVYALACDNQRLFSSSSEGEVKEWDPDTLEFRQMTILIVIDL